MRSVSFLFGCLATAALALALPIAGSTSPLEIRAPYIPEKEYWADAYPDVEPEVVDEVQPKADAEKVASSI